jgi:phospholipase/carboxylesterase
MINRLTSVADALGAALLAPDSRGRTWDAIRGEFGEDPAFIDRALARTFDRCAIDPARVWLCGFSDGASYGLSLGLANGDFFSRVLAFSPGFVIPAERHGKPRIFVSHGRQDPILPIDRASRAIVPQLKREGYDVRFDEFEGGHRMPPGILAAAILWLGSK